MVAGEEATELEQLAGKRNHDDHIEDDLMSGIEDDLLPEPREGDDVDGIRRAIRGHDMNTLKSDLERLKDSISSDVNFKLRLNAVDVTGNCFIHHATAKNNLAACKLLLEYGASLDRKRNDGSTPLHLAIRYNNSEIATWLLENGADVTIMDRHDSLPLHLAAELCLADLCSTILSQMKTKISAVNIFGNSALHYAAMTGNIGLCKKLLQHGVRVDMQNSKGATPIHLAASLDNTELMGVLLDKERIGEVNIQSATNLKMKDGRTALHIACRSGSNNVAKLLLDVGMKVEDSDTISPVHLAALGGYRHILTLLFDHQFSPNVKDVEGKTPLHYAALFDKSDCCQQLINHGAGVNARDLTGCTPLLCAVKKGHYQCVTLLLAQGSNVSLGDHKLRTCIHEAVRNKDVRMIRMLLPQKSYISRLKDYNLQTPLHHAAKCGHEAILKLLLRNYFTVEDVDFQKRTALHLAAQGGHKEAVRILTLGAKGDDIDCRDDKMMTPLHLAAIKGHRDICSYLVKCKANLHARDVCGKTPIHHLIIDNRVDILSEILKPNTDLNLPDYNEDTPMYLAVKHNNVEAVQFLLDRGASLLRREKGKEISILADAVDLKSNNIAAAIVSHQRWPTAKQNKVVWNDEVMNKLITAAPDIAEMVMDQAIQYSDHHPDDEELTVTYDLRLLEVHLGTPKRKAKEIFSSKETVRAPTLTNMIKYKRSNLLGHPLMNAYILTKWNSFVGFLFNLTFLAYLFFVISLTVLILMMRNVTQYEEQEAANMTVTETTRTVFRMKSKPARPWERAYGRFFATVAFIFCVIMILKEITRIYLRRMRYFKDLRNLLEWTLFACCILYLGAFLFDQEYLRQKIKDRLGGVCLFLSWSNLILYLENFPASRLYIVMFIEVLLTLLRVLLAFSAMLIGFGLTYYHLFRAQDAYATIPRSILKTIAMAVDGTDYDSTITDNIGTSNSNSGLAEVPFPSISYVAVSVFLVVISVALMNLLIGLAVGDIDSIRQSATLRSVKQQIRYIVDIQTNIPMLLYRKLHKTDVTFMPNKKTRMQRIIDAILPRGLRWDVMDHKALLWERRKQNMDKGCEGGSLADVKKVLASQESELRSLKEKLEEQGRFLKEELDLKQVTTPPIYFPAK